MAKKRLGERLTEAGLVTQEAIAQGLAHQRITGYKLGDCLVELGLVTEAALLRLLASDLGTRYVATEKLAQVKIGSDVLDRVPVRMAEQQLVLPIAFDSTKNVLSVLMSEPQNEDLAREIAMVAGVDEVVTLLGLRTAILAGIKRHYYGDPTAFSHAEAPGPIKLEAPVRPEQTGPAARPRDDNKTRPWQVAPQPSALRDPQGSLRGTVAEADYLESLHVLVGLLEQGRRHFRGHSAQLSRHARTIAGWLGLQPNEGMQVAIAALLHDLGKPADRHFTVPSNAVNADWKADAKKYLRAPIRLFEAVHLPGQVNAILAQLYEAYDGSGIPNGNKEDEIAAGARILAALDAFLSLTRDPHNAFGRVLSKPEALAHLHDQAGKLYDPRVVEAIARLVTGDLLRQRLSCEGRMVLLAESDDGVRGPLSEALFRVGLVTHAVASLDGIPEAALRGEGDVLVLSLRLGVSELASIVQFLRSQPQTAGLPVWILGEPDPASRDALLQSEITGFIPLPLQIDPAAQTILTSYQQHVRTGGPARPVQGSIEELSWKEILGILGQGRKSGRLTVRREGVEGALFLEEGRLRHAVVRGKPPEQALSVILSEPTGEFVFDGNALLMELPTHDTDLGMVVRELERARSA